MEKTADLDLNQLDLDEKNPRLPTGVGRQQNEMIAYIARTTSIAEIMSAIAQNGYFPGEPLIVVQERPGRFVAVEGNRRLAALKLLQEPEIMARNRKVQEIANGAKYKPTQIPCVIFGDRLQVVNYLGYRHITGVKQWEPLAKARYIAAYFDEHTDKNLSNSARYQEVARGIGSQGPYIKRQLDGIAVYNVIESQEFFGITDLDEENISFSLLSTAVGYSSILTFLASDENPYLNPKALINEHIEFISRFMFEKNSKGDTGLGDSRNIQRLAVVMADPGALEGLMSGDTLDKAYSSTRGMPEDLSSHLSDAEAAITEAVSMIALVEVDDSHRRQIDNIYKQARFLRSAMLKDDV